VETSIDCDKHICHRMFAKTRMFQRSRKTCFSTGRFSSSRMQKLRAHGRSDWPRSHTIAKGFCKEPISTVPFLTVLPHVNHLAWCPSPKSEGIRPCRLEVPRHIINPTAPVSSLPLHNVVKLKGEASESKGMAAEGTKFQPLFVRRPS
jgi:hypothetical protein